MNVLQAVILAIVEGVTEFLPISSTGHLILVSRLLAIPATDFVKSFEIFIQAGAILAVVVMYFKELITNYKLWPKLVAAFVPTALVGLVLYKPIKAYLLGSTSVVLWSLFVGGILLIVFEKFIKKGNKTRANLDLKSATLIGIAQAISVVPGVSRAAATIVGAMVVGLSREEAVKFSFWLAIPTMVAATGLDLLKSGWSFSGSEWTIMVVGFVGAFVTAWVAVKYFLEYVRKHDFVGFGVYRLILAVVLGWWLRPQ